MTSLHADAARRARGVDEEATRDDDWPTTQRFSRHVGEAFHDSEYAAAIERSSDTGRIASRAAAILIVGALLGAAVVVVWQGA